MSDILFNKKMEIRKAIKAKFTPEIIEEFFGLTIKHHSEKGGSSGDIDLWNVYDKETGELLLPKLYAWDLEDLFKYIGFDACKLLRESAPEDDNTGNVLLAEHQMKMAQKAYEEKYYRTCPICGFRYDSSCQTHHHI